jgi:hypothetical protein
MAAAFNARLGGIGKLCIDSEGAGRCRQPPNRAAQPGEDADVATQVFEFRHRRRRGLRSRLRRRLGRKRHTRQSAAGKGERKSGQKITSIEFQGKLLVGYAP